MSSEDPPAGCNLACLQKWFEDHQINGAKLVQIGNGAEAMHARHAANPALVFPDGFLAGLPELLKEQVVIHDLIVKHRRKWRKLCGFKGQGQPAGQT